MPEERRLRAELEVPDRVKLLISVLSQQVFSYVSQVGVSQMAFMDHPLLMCQA